MKSIPIILILLGQSYATNFGPCPAEGPNACGDHSESTTIATSTSSAINSFDALESEIISKMMDTIVKPPGLGEFFPPTSTNSASSSTDSSNADSFSTLTSSPPTIHTPSITPSPSSLSTVEVTIYSTTTIWIP